MDKPTFRDVKASGIRLRVTEVGSGPCLLLLHSVFFDRSTWDATAKELAGRFRVVVPDLPGFGESEKPGPARFSYEVQAFADAVTDLYAGLSLGQAYVAGHGLGGAIALTIASQNAELVSRLILVDSLCYPTRPDITRRVALLPLLGGFAFKQLFGKAMFRSYFKEVLCAPKSELSTSVIDRYYETFNTPSARNSALNTLRTTIDTRPVVAHTTRVGVPSLVIWGRHDAVYPAAFGRRLAREIPGAGFELLDCGHSPPEERPKPLAAAIQKFCLAERPSSPR